MGQAICKPSEEGGNKYIISRLKDDSGKPVKSARSDENEQLHDLIDQLVTWTARHSISMPAHSATTSVNSTASSNKKERKQQKELRKQVFAKVTNLLGRENVALLMAQDVELHRQTVVQHATLDQIREWLILHPESMDKILKDPQVESTLKMRQPSIARLSTGSPIAHKSEISLADRTKLSHATLSQKGSTFKLQPSHLGSQIGSQFLVPPTQQSIPALPDWVVQESGLHGSSSKATVHSDTQTSSTEPTQKGSNTNTNKSVPSRPTTPVNNNVASLPRSTLAQRSNVKRSLLALTTTADSTADETWIESVDFLDGIIRDMTEIGSGGSLAKSMEPLLRRIVKLLHVEAASIVLLNESRDSFYQKITIVRSDRDAHQPFQLLHQIVRFPVNTPSILSRVALAGECISISDAQKHTRWRAEIDSWQKDVSVYSMMAISLHACNDPANIMGVLVAYNKKSTGSDPSSPDASASADVDKGGHKFTAVDERLLVYLMSWTAQALFAAIRYQALDLQLQAAYRQSEIISTVAGSKDPVLMLQTVLSELSGMFHAPIINLYFLNDKMQVLNLTASLNNAEVNVYKSALCDSGVDTLPPPNTDIFLSIPDHPACRVMLTGETNYGVRSEPTATGQSSSSLQASATDRRLIYAPIMKDNTVVGVLQLSRNRPRTPPVEGEVSLDEPLEFTELNMKYAQRVVNAIYGAFDKSAWHQELLRQTTRDKEYYEEAKKAFLSSTLAEMELALGKTISSITKGNIVRMFIKDIELDCLRLWPVNMDVSFFDEDIRIRCSKGIVGWAATSGEAVMVDNMKEHLVYHASTDLPKESSEEANSPVLCVPIKEADEVILVIQVIGRVDGTCFTAEEQEALASFGSLLGFHLFRVRMEERQFKAKIQTQQVDRIISVERYPSEEELQELVDANVLAANAQGFHGLNTVNFHCGLSTMMERSGDIDTVSQLFLRMFIDLDWISAYDIPYETLCRFILSYRRAFKRHPYRTIYHSLHATHIVYFFLTSCNYDKVGWMTDLEAFALFLSAMLRDLIFPSTFHSSRGKNEISFRSGASFPCSY
jgi:GAF domain-containing protein